MKFIADLHIHSHHSIATSKNLIPEQLEQWARIKGINVVGTGDCVHPGWLKELREKLEPAENGLYRLKKEFRLKQCILPHETVMPPEVFFALTGEISNIYKSAGQVRKVHNLCVFPDFDSVEQAQKKLSEIGNILSDGRPILGLDARDLLEILLESSSLSYLIPAHIWTPWFSVLGSKSGFDTVEECYRDLAHHIFAVETGLSSDPPMNRACSFLDKYTLVSNSDAHSPENLGREANIFECDMSFDSIYRALKTKKGYSGTIEFFPQEGKYHYDGHRKCNICWDPSETVKNKGICTVCKKPVTKGVMFRVAELADRQKCETLSNFFSITPLPQLLSEVLKQKNKAGKVVRAEYFRLIEKLGPEFHILLYADKTEISKQAGAFLAEGVQRLREGRVHIQDGYDGEFGRIKVFDEEELDTGSFGALFSADKNTGNKKFSINEFRSLYVKAEQADTGKVIEHTNNDEQKAGIEHFKGPCMVLAGPGSGKTRILTERIKYLVTEKSILPGEILAITFSNKASAEIKRRFEGHTALENVPVMTFHSFGLSVLKENYEKSGREKDFVIIEDNKKDKLIGEYKQGITVNEKARRAVEQYEKEMCRRNAFDLDDLIYLPVELFKNDAGLLKQYQNKYKWILVDEYQDINARQYELLKLLSGVSANLFVIGDPDQAIYSFRGSDIRFIGQFKKDFPRLKIIELKNSYRCPGLILKAAGQVLKKNSFLAGSGDDIKIHIQSCDTERSEADWIASRIEKMIGGVRSYSLHTGISDGETAGGTNTFSDFAIFCRTTMMFDSLLEALKKHGIPVQVTGAQPLYCKEPFKSAVDVLRDAYYNQKNHDILNMIKEKKNISDILILILQGKEAQPEELTKFSRITGSFENNYHKFFEDVSLRQGVDDFDERAQAVSLMTLHASKGLEFNTVFIPGCEEGIIPFEIFEKKDDKELSEEERLFYVGITRTKRNLFFSYARLRYFKGRRLNLPKSRFLGRIEKELLFEGTRKSKNIKPDDKQLNLLPLGEKAG